MFSVNWFCTHTTAISQTPHLGSFPSTPLEMYSSLSRTLAMPASLFHAPHILDSLVGIYIVWQIFGNINCYTSILTQGEGRRPTTRPTATMHIFQNVLLTTGNPKLIRIIWVSPQVTNLCPGTLNWHNPIWEQTSVGFICSATMSRNSQIWWW